MDSNRLVFLRVMAFLIDFLILMALIVVGIKALTALNAPAPLTRASMMMFAWVPLAFFLYWSLGLNVGKRLVRLRVVDARTGERPTLWQWFRRALPFCLLIPLNMLFLVPVLLDDENRALHDRLAGTRVVYVGPEKGA